MNTWTQWLRRTVLPTLLALLSLFALLAVGHARAQPVPDADARAVRAVVEAQLSALAADDAERAFSYATPALRGQFGNAATFMAMVQQGYPMVIRPAATVFFVPQREDGGVRQQVRFRTRDGQLWMATYRLVRGADYSWRIGGCTVTADSEARAT